jgi:hypothetical protein
MSGLETHSRADVVRGHPGIQPRPLSVPRVNLSHASRELGTARVDAADALGTFGVALNASCLTVWQVFAPKALYRHQARPFVIVWQSGYTSFGRVARGGGSRTSNG